MYSLVNPTQKVFRVLVKAMSYPGRVYRLPVCQESNLWRTPLLALAQTLLDHEVTFAFIGRDNTLAQKVYAATKSRQVELEEANFVIIEGSQSYGQITHVNRGSSVYPEQGATIIYVLGQSNDGRDTQQTDIVLTGPGIKEPFSPQLTGLSIEEFKEIQLLNREYPLGVDCIFLNDEGQVMCLPRSTRIRIP